MNALATLARAIELGLILALCAFIGTLSYMAGSDKSELAAVQREVVTAKAHLAALEKLQADMDSLELRASQADARLKSQQRSHQQELIRYAQSHRDDGCRLDTDGLRLWRNANARAHPSSERDAVDAPGLPADPAAAGRGAPDPAGEPLDSRGPVSGVRGQAPRAGAGDLPARGGSDGAVQ